ncbi:MAG: NADP-dependent malic enzyme [Hyphomicrobium sp.]|uniref:NADP-dependent malic enzyme n=1 Tax=Hyphomicrobium sp. TaxID=82 RepID=UPI00132C6039|nr:NADP-dependent malic enzyme [Hyphomicrobium sp.]KAB2941605.1 MAG: NADP-dependent malic enzyme [Hyphomicrobium sp.]MBZ0210197.1 NADP-dependent malic enzyme [Hyphomicrobium sp.]
MTTARSSKATQARFTDQEALQFHAQGKPGKLEITPTKPLATQRDLSLAYSPGVAVPVHAIAQNPATAYDYTNKGNLVAVVSNGTAILGLGNLGALAAKPVMEGKGALFKRFADIDAIDLLVDTEDPDQFINSVRYLGPSFGGINLEDVRAPDCFIIEQRLKELLDIPVFHDDQHGTAIIAAAGLINAAELTGRELKNCKLVVNGAGAAGIACLELVVALGIPKQNVILCDTKGVVYQGRKEGMNQWKSAYAAKTKARTLAQALEGADALFGLSVKGAVTQDMVRAMADKPIIFAMANPDPEITPEDVLAVRDDAIVATGRSDYPNQINNVLGFPFIFRGALDVQASTINEAMKIAAAEALADLARAEVPDQVAAAFHGRRPTFGPEYIIPAPFDPRLIVNVPTAVAKAAMDSGVARKPIVDMDAYVAQLEGRLDPLAGWLQSTFSAVRSDPKRVVFAEGEEPAVIRAAHSYFSQGFGVPILIGSTDVVREQFRALGMVLRPEYEILDTRKNPYMEEFSAYLYARLQRRGYLKRDCQRLVANERNVFGMLMVAHGHADALVSGVTRNWTSVYDDVQRVIDAEPGRNVIGVSLALLRGRAVLIADTSVHDMPTAEELADIATEAARAARNFGIEPRVALLAYSTFGQPRGERSDQMREAVAILDERQVDFEYDGDMAADVALNRDLMRHYPFCRLSDTANVLVMPAFHAASISTNMLKELGGATVIGPILVGLSRSVQICGFGAKDSDVVNMAAIAAYDAGRRG